MVSIKHKNKWLLITLILTAIIPIIITVFDVSTSEKKSVVGYGAAAKGNTLLNFGGVKPDLLSYVCDAAPSKQQKYMPGSHIPILHPREMMIKKPKWILIFPWNISDEVTKSYQAKT